MLLQSRVIREREDYNSCFDSWIDKKRHGINKWICSRTKIFRGRVKFELELSNYATKGDLKNAAGVDTSKCAKKFVLANLKYNVDKLDNGKLKKYSSNLSNLKSKVDKLDVNKLVIFTVDLSKLSNIVKKDKKHWR